MVSLRTLIDCLDVDDDDGQVSVLGHIFGFIRRRVPFDFCAGAPGEVSLLTQVRAVQDPHIHLNVIKVGFDVLPDTTAALERIDYAIYRAREIYAQVPLGVGRVNHYFITAAEADGADVLDDKQEADDLSDEWSVDNGGIDAFIVRNIAASDFIGISPVGGSCQKPSKRDGMVAGEIAQPFREFARTFSHELGHFLGLSHPHGKDDCPDSGSGLCDNLMAQSPCANTCGSGVCASTNLTRVQGAYILGEVELLPPGIAGPLGLLGQPLSAHCSVRDGC